MLATLLDAFDEMVEMEIFQQMGKSGIRGMIRLTERDLAT